jgi:hypothetical protein
MSIANARYTIDVQLQYLSYLLNYLNSSRNHYKKLFVIAKSVKIRL